MTARIRKVGGSLALTLPKGLVAHLAAGDHVELTEQDGGILITPSRRRARRPIEELVKQIDPKAYARHGRTFLRDPPVGKEIW